MNKKSIILGLIGLGATLIGFLGKAFYREYVHSHKISDFGLNGYLPSYFYVLGFSLLLLIRPTKQPKLVIAIVAAASICYEIMQYISSGRLDFPDILASVGGGLTAILILTIVERKYSE
jgi:MFS family permease